MGIPAALDPDGRLGRPRCRSSQPPKVLRCREREMAQAPGQPWILLVEPLHTPQAMPSLLLPPSGPREARVDAEQVRPAKESFVDADNGR